MNVIKRAGLGLYRWCMRHKVWTAVIVIAVAHRQFRELGAAGIRAFGKSGSLLYDVKYLLPAADSDDRL